MTTTRLMGSAVALGALAVLVMPGCSLGEGTGTCMGTLNIPDCWSGTFDLHPDFFAAVPGATPHYPMTTTDTMQIRIQNGSGGDFETFSDGILILVDDAGQVRGDPAPDGTPRPSLLGQTLVVSLPAGVFPPGVPVTPVADPRIVHATLYLDHTCRTENDTLDAMDAVSGVDPGSGECWAPESGSFALTCPGPATVSDGGTAGGDAAPGDGGAAGADAGSGEGGAEGGAAPAGVIGTSTITFRSLFDGNPDESNASERLTDASFNFYFADPRQTCSGGLGPPPPCRAHLAGSFKFYFQRGRPAQPFP
jgi:hypothetical protein